MAESSRYLRSKTFKLLAHVGAVVTMSAWGTSFLSSKVLMADGGFTPVEVFVYRFVFAYFILLIFTFKKLFSNNWKDELQLLVCGVCAGSIYFITENYALQYTTAGNVSLLAGISPIFTTILLACIYQFMPKVNVILGSLIAFTGVACIILSSGDGFEIHPTGDILALCAALSWAIYTIAVKRLNPIYNSLFITRKLFFYGVITALPLLCIQEAPLHLNLLFDFNQPEFALNFLFLGLMCSACAYLIWNEVMKSLGSITANNYLYLQPLVTMVAAYFFIGEEIVALGYVGCALIIGGLVISDKLEFKRKG